MPDEHRTIQELSSAVMWAARCVAEPIQQQIVASDQREKEIQWIGIAYESLSFYIVLATRMAQSYGLTKAQSMVNALGRTIVPEIAARFFSRNPIDVQQQAIDSFQLGHHQAEIEYGACRKILPEDEAYDADSMVSVFAYKLLAIVERDARAAILPGIFASIQSPEGAPRIFMLVGEACGALPDGAS